MTLSNLRDGIKIRKRQRGISGRLAKNEFCVGLNGIFNSLRIREVNKAERHSKGDELFAADAVGAAVAAVGDDAVISGLHECVDARCRRCHTSAHTDGVVAILDLGHLFLQHFDSGVVGAAVAESLLQIFVNRFLDEGGAHVDGSENRTRFFIGADSSVNDAGVQGAFGDPVAGFGAE